MAGRALLNWRFSTHGWSFPVFASLCALVEAGSRIFTEVHPTRLLVIPALVRVAAYAGRMVREPESWHPDPGMPPLEQWQSLLTHLFELWPVPPAFAGAWLIHGPVVNLERDWYCHLAAGGSIRRLPGILPLRAGTVRELARAPAGLSARQAIRWAQLRALRCPDPFMGTVLRSRMAEDLSNDGLWIPLLEKFIAASRVEEDAFDSVVDGFLYLMRGSDTPQAYRLLREPLPVLIRHWRKRWRHLMEQALPECLWQDYASHPRPSRLRNQVAMSLLTPWEKMPEVGGFVSHAGSSRRFPWQWSITEICSRRQLLEEGTLMRHCVTDYAPDCEKGESAIFRMRGYGWAGKESFHGCFSWTIRLNRKTRRIAEIKGYRNALPGRRACQVIRKWAMEKNLKLPWGWE